MCYKSYIKLSWLWLKRNPQTVYLKSRLVGNKFVLISDKTKKVKNVLPISSYKEGNFNFLLALGGKRETVLFIARKFLGRWSIFSSPFWFDYKNSVKQSKTTKEKGRPYSYRVYLIYHSMRLKLDWRERAQWQTNKYFKYSRW